VQKETNDQFEQARWQEATIPAYKPIKDGTEWMACPKCNRKPRVWIFDNGNYAKCQCSKKYDSSNLVSYQSIGDYYRKFKTTAEYDNDGLMKAWNSHVEMHELSQARAKVTAQTKSDCISIF